MKINKKIFLLIILVLTLVISGSWFLAESFRGNSLSPHSTSATVNIENGVSGVVTVTDPTLNQSVDINVDFYLLSTGSGVIVSPEGHIITAFHVVGDPRTLETGEKLKKMDDNDIKRYVEEGAVIYYVSNYNPRLGAELSNTQYGSNKTLLTDLFVQKNLVNVKSYEQVIKVNFPSSAGINDNNSLKARLIDVGDPNRAQDVALLKVDAVNQNLPTVNISRENPTIGEEIRIYGYPYNNSQNQTTNQPVTPSSTTGFLIVPVPHSLGTIYYQTTALTAQGYSGGPVFDNKNQLLGIVVFGVQIKKLLGKYTTGEYTSFLPSNYILEICNKNNVPVNVV